MLIMKYNFVKIGERLKKERKAAGFKSHDALKENITDNNYRSFTRQTIAKWEKGKEMPPLDVLCSLCIPFQCEIGYLLCEYDCKTREHTDIQKATGLTEQAIESIQHMWLKTLTKDERSLAVWNDSPDVPEMQYRTALSSLNDLREYWSKHGEFIKGYKANPEAYMEDLIEEKKGSSRTLSALNALLSHPAGINILENLYAFLNFEYVPSEEEIEATKEHNQRYGTNYKSVIRGKNGDVNSEYLNNAFLIALQNNCMELKKEIRKEASDTD